jgi:hypothetical protein
MPVRGRIWLAIAAGLLAVGLPAGCGGDDGDNASPSELQAQLISPDQIPPLQDRRDFSWDDPTDFVVQGVFYPENTRPSAVIGAIDDAGFQAGAGRYALPKGEGGPDVYFDVAQFDSEDGARQAQEYLHGQDLQQPCYAACVVNPEEYDVSGIPGAKAVHQVPNGRKGPPGTEPFERFVVEFTIGPDLYIVDTRGDPGDVPPDQFNAGSKRVYDFAKQHSG